MRNVLTGQASKTLSNGKLSEWFNVLRSKRRGCKSSAGSNPALSAKWRDILIGKEPSWKGGGVNSPWEFEPPSLRHFL